MVEFPPATPFTSQVTAVLVEVLAFVTFTVAVKSACDPGVTDAAVGVIETEVTVALPLPPPPHPERIPIAAIRTGRAKSA